jgi:hypothetical protein
MAAYLGIAAGAVNLIAAALWFYAVPPKYTREGVMWDLPTGKETSFDRGVRLASWRNRAAAFMTGLGALLSGTASLV